MAKQPPSHKPIVSVIGGSDAIASPIALKEARQLGTLIAEAGMLVCCGGLGGVMRAVCEGARGQATADQIATIGILPGYDASQANQYVDICIPTGAEHMRNVVVVSTGHVVVAIGGGAGTLNEIALAWAMGKPLILLDIGDGWSHRLATDPRLDGRTRPAMHVVSSSTACFQTIMEQLQTPYVAPSHLSATATTNQQ